MRSPYPQSRGNNIIKDYWLKGVTMSLRRAITRRSMVAMDEDFDNSESLTSDRLPNGCPSDPLEAQRI